MCINCIAAESFLVQIPDGLFFSEVKNKPIDGIAIHAFILGAGVVTNISD